MVVVQLALRSLTVAQAAKGTHVANELCNGVLSNGASGVLSSREQPEGGSLVRVME